MSISKKRLCIILPAHWAAAFGGAEYQARCLIDAIREANSFEITYLARDTNPKFNTKQYKIYNVGINNFLRRYATFFDAIKLFMALKSIAPDVIYQRVGCSYTGVAAWYAKKNRCNMIWHVALDTDLMDFQGNFSPRSILKYVEFLFMQYGIRNCSKIITQTKFQDKLLYRRFGRKADWVVPNFHHNPTEVLDKKLPIKIVWVANLKPFKRPELFVNLANQFKTCRDIKFILIGEPHHKKQWLDLLFQKINNASNVEYMSNMSFHDVNEILAKSHIFVNTSLYEGFPNTFIQAWMRCVPVVSLSINPDGVLNNKNIGICSGTFEQLIKDVKKLVEDSSFREKMGRQAKKYVMKTHSMQNANKIIELMNS